MAASVMIFAPAPLLTVTVEQPADEVELHIHPGGQGIWQARMITALAITSLTGIRDVLGAESLAVVGGLLAGLVSADHLAGYAGLALAPYDSGYRQPAPAAAL
jgi:hypothetical protein